MKNMSRLIKVNRREVSRAGNGAKKSADRRRERCSGKRDSVDGSHVSGKKRRVCLMEMKNRSKMQDPAEVYTVDMRKELKNGNRSILSEQLQRLMKERLEKKEQTMLFLNRRGYSGFVSCRECGHVIKCPHCDVSLSVHRDGKMRCHYCGYEQTRVKICPECGSDHIGEFRAGTQRIEEIVKTVFPQARVLRMDMDTTRQKDSHEKILSAFANEEADVLVGTQMIVKGHDFPNVTLVGILAADMSLYTDDYRSGERTFQLLTQAVGRAGRGDKKGEAVIQTYSPIIMRSQRLRRRIMRRSMRKRSDTER